MISGRSPAAEVRAPPECAFGPESGTREEAEAGSSSPDSGSATPAKVRGSLPARSSKGAARSARAPPWRLGAYWDNREVAGATRSQATGSWVSALWSAVGSGDGPALPYTSAPRAAIVLPLGVARREIGGGSGGSLAGPPPARFLPCRAAASSCPSPHPRRTSLALRRLPIDLQRADLHRRERHQRPPAAARRWRQQQQQQVPPSSPNVKLPVLQPHGPAGWHRTCAHSDRQ